MNRTLTIYLFLGAFSCVMANAGDPTAQVTFRVTDDFGNAVTNASVRMTTAAGWIPGPDTGRTKMREAEGHTDTNGAVVLKLQCKTGNIRHYEVVAAPTASVPHYKMSVGGKMYYRERGGRVRFSEVVNGRWEPWNPTVEIVLKEVLNPIPMYARSSRVQSLTIPSYNQPLGFDLIKSDWLPPHGRGETADFIFTLDCQLLGMSHDNVQYFDAALRLSFSNDGDGLQEVLAHPREGSTLRLPRYAPESGYRSEWIQKAYEHQDEARYDHKENQNFIFRIRTREDEHGKITSALY
ncbi:MAG: hypothetical protein KJ626_12195 [Verrucomicrobia bacterium]|nr:hypothetical protein [Verrucomicrobiota bacterium]